MYDDNLNLAHARIGSPGQLHVKPFAGRASPHSNPSDQLVSLVRQDKAQA